MPKIGMEPIRRAALINATIAEIGEAGSLDVTVGQIARRAGVSSGLAHHYFGGKDDILLAAMRHVMRVYAREVLIGLSRANSPIARVEAIVRGAFAQSNFQSDAIAAWLNFYVLALSSPSARRLHKVYASRSQSNLSNALRPLVGGQAPAVAARALALIDGLYLHHGLTPQQRLGEAAVEDVMRFINLEIGSRS